MGTYSGDNESAGADSSRRPPRMRRLLDQAARAARKPSRKHLREDALPSGARLKDHEASAMAPRKRRLFGLILLHLDGEPGNHNTVSKKSKPARTAGMIRQLRSLLYQANYASNPA